MKLTSLALLVLLVFSCQPAQTQTADNHPELVKIYRAWRSFETPPLKDGAPDYTKETFEKRWPDFKKLQKQLNELDTTGWSVKHQVDWHIIWAEMNGYDFNHRILKPWVRDPAFYKSLWMSRSDVPAHEGPTHHGTTEIWTYEFPLSTSERDRLLSELKVIPALNNQAKKNLTGNARELWIAGIRDIQRQSRDLQGLLDWEGIKNETQIIAAIQEAIESTDDLAAWLEAESSKKTGPSGIGKDNYTWYMQKVHLVPLSWEDEVMILKTELASAWSNLKLEEHRNRNLPEMVSAESPEAYDALAEKSVRKFMDFLENQDIVTVKDYWEPALREHKGSFVPKKTRNFFYIAMHYEPMTLYSHFYHWFELARMDNEPHPSEVRRAPLLYNIFDSRNEGVATGVEEMFMHAGLYDDTPRAREIIYILIAQRAARGLGSLYAHANEMTMEEAGGIHSNYTPRGWMKTEKELLLFEQHLYMRQPGYGTSYITGKHLLRNAMAEFARIKEAKGEPFVTKDFFDQLNSIGCIPMSLGHWQMTGMDEEVRRITK